MITNAFPYFKKNRLRIFQNILFWHCNSYRIIILGTHTVPSISFHNKFKELTSWRIIFKFSFSDSAILKIPSHLSVFCAYSFRYLSHLYLQKWAVETWGRAGEGSQISWQLFMYRCQKTVFHLKPQWYEWNFFFSWYSMAMVACWHPGSTVCTMEGPGVREQHFLSLMAHALGKLFALGFYLSSRKEHRVEMTLLKLICLFTDYISLISVLTLMNLIFDAQTHDSFWMFLLPRYPYSNLPSVTLLSKHFRIINELWFQQRAIRKQYSNVFPVQKEIKLECWNPNFTDA